MSGNEESENLSALGYDIEIQSSPEGHIHDFNHWDLIMENHDYTITSGEDTLFNACVIAVLTGYNEIGDRYENETYSEFGDPAYELLKTNKSELVKFKIEEYIKKVLKNIRRVMEIVEVVVSEDEFNPYAYNVFFHVIGLDDEHASGEVNLGSGKDEKYATTCRIRDLTNNNILIIRSNEGVMIQALLKDSRNRGVSKELLTLNSIMGLDEDTKLTNNTGSVTYLYIPNKSIDEDNIYVSYNGSSSFKPCISNTLRVLYLFFSLKIVDGELIYTYDDDYYHPDFKLNSEGELIMTYDPGKLSFNNIYLNDNGNLIMEIKG